MLAISFLEFMKKDQKELIEGMKKRCEDVFPPILVLMNINGCLVHRTDQIVKFLKPNDTSENIDSWGRFVKMFKHKRNFVYFRDGYEAFLESVMQHPRIKFAFYSNIIRANIFPIIKHMFKDNLHVFSENMLAIFDQEYCKKIKDFSEEENKSYSEEALNELGEYGMVRELEKVLNSSTLKNCD